MLVNIDKTTFTSVDFECNPIQHYYDLNHKIKHIFNLILAFIKIHAKKHENN